MKKRKHLLAGLLRGLLLPAIVVVVLLAFATAVNSLDGGRDAEGLRQLEQALRRSCVACYAAEGIYPPDLEYLEEHYGIQVDRDRYTVYYNVFAGNLMPDITVLENKS